MEVEKETPIWYAMRATYRREPDAMRLLEKEKLGCFVPMQYKISIKKGKKVRVLVPVIHNLLFVHACPSEVKRIKSQVTYLQYITDTRSGQKIIISDSEMQRFIAVAGTYNDHLMYFQPDELNLSKGTKVRITGGLRRSGRYFPESKRCSRSSCSCCDTRCHSRCHGYYPS